MKGACAVPADPFEGLVIRFADDQSRLNAIEAISCAVARARGFFVISGSVPGVGKTTLARHILSFVSAEVCETRWEGRGKVSSREICRHAGRGYLLLDDVYKRGLRERGGRLLVGLAAADSIHSTRPCSAVLTVPNNTLVVITGNSLDLPGDLARRAKRIELLPVDDDLPMADCDRKEGA